MSEAAYGFKENKTRQRIPYRDLLWSNSNIAADFAAQTITLAYSMADYDYIQIEHKQTVNRNRTVYNIAPDIEYESTFYLNKLIVNTAGTVIGYQRGAKATSNTQLYFEDAVELKSTGTTVTKNGAMVPYKIYGIKYPS